MLIENLIIESEIKTMTNLEFFRRLGYHSYCVDECTPETFHNFEVTLGRVRVTHDETEDSLYYLLIDKDTNEVILRYTLGFSDNECAAEFIDRFNSKVDFSGSDYVSDDILKFDDSDDWLNEEFELYFN